MKSAVLTLVVLTVTLGADPAYAADFAGGTLTVARDDTTADCPDEAALSRATLALGTLPDAPRAPLNVELAFRREGATYVADIRTSGSAQGVREVAKDGASCAPLAEAVTVVLAVLFDLTPRETNTANPPQPLATAAVAPPPPLPPLPPSERRGTHGSIGVALSGGGAYGLLGPAFVGTLSGAVRPRLGHFELALGGLWAPNRTVEHAPGRVFMSLAAGRLAGCAWLQTDVAQPDLGLCVGFLAGALRAEGDGYAENYPPRDAWFALEAGTQGRWPFTRNLAINMGISLLIPTRRQSFTVANAGVAFETSPVAAWLEVGPELRFP